MAQARDQTVSQEAWAPGLFPTVSMDDLARHVLPWASVSPSKKRRDSTGSFPSSDTPGFQVF